MVVETPTPPQLQGWLTDVEGTTSWTVRIRVRTPRAVHDLTMALGQDKGITGPPATPAVTMPTRIVR